MPFCHMLIFFKIHFLEKFFQEYHKSAKVWPDLDPNFMQRLSADNTSRQRVKGMNEVLTCIFEAVKTVLQDRQSHTGGIVEAIQIGKW